MAKKKIDKEIEKEEDIELEDDLDLNEDVEESEILDDFDDEVNSEDYRELSLEDKVNNIDNKLNVIIVIVVIALLFSAVNTIFILRNDTSDSSANQASNTGSNTSTAQYDTSAFKVIVPSDIATESKSETIVVWIGHQGCSYCKIYAPIIEAVAKEYGVQARYIDLAKIVDFTVTQPYIQDTDAWDILDSLTGSGDWSTFVSDNLSGTPLTFIVKNNKVIGGLSGYAEETELEEVFKDAGFSK